MFMLIIICVQLISTLQLVLGEEEPFFPNDTSRNLILPNFRMFSEMKNVFYNVDTGNSVPIKYVKEIPGTDLLTKGFGLIPCSCQHQNLKCSCCAYVKIQRFHFERTACSNLSVSSENLELDLTINYSGYTLANRSLSLRHPPPFCIPTPQIPALLSCIRVHDITVKDGHIEMCINFEIKVVAIQNPVFVLEFTCVNYGPDGFILERPSSHHNSHDNGTFPQSSNNLELLQNHLFTGTTQPSTTLSIEQVESSTMDHTKENLTQPSSETPMKSSAPPVMTESQKVSSSSETTPKPMKMKQKPSIELHHSISAVDRKNTPAKLTQRTQQNDHNEVSPKKNVDIISLDIFDYHKIVTQKKRSGSEGGYLTFDGY